MVNELVMADAYYMIIIVVNGMLTIGKERNEIVNN